MTDATATATETKRLSRKEKNELLRAQFQVEHEPAEEDINVSPVSALVSSHRSVSLKPQMLNEPATVEAITASADEAPAALTTREEEAAESTPQRRNNRNNRTQGITISPHDQDALDSLMTFAIENKLRVGRAGPSLFYAVGLHAMQDLIKTNPDALRNAIRKMAAKRGEGELRRRRMDQR